MREEKRLSELRVGEACRILEIYAEGRLGRRLSDLGAVAGAEISCVGVSPLGDPRAYLLLGSIFAIRNRDAALVRVAPRVSVAFGCEDGSRDERKEK